MSKAKNTQHISEIRRKRTIIQFCRRIVLLYNDKKSCSLSNQPAYNNQAQLLDYTHESLEIESISRPAISRLEVTIFDIKSICLELVNNKSMSDFEYHALLKSLSQYDDGKGFNALNVLQIKLKDLQSTLLSKVEDSSHELSNKKKTKKDLENEIKENKILIHSLIKELIMQRSAYNQLFEFMKKNMPKNQSMLELYRKTHKKALMETNTENERIKVDFRNELIQLLSDEISNASNSVAEFKQ